MPILTDYEQFNGRHWETGSVANFYAYRGLKAPHTGAPYSEALFMGISGGAVMGYFSFAYEGVDPHVRILTRNTFDPLDTMLSRLGVVQHRLQTSKPDKGVQNLVETLADGVPAIVWADMFSLPYNHQPFDEGMWVMFPVLVYGYDEAADTVWIADRARVPLTVTPAELHAARARVKKEKFRVLILDPPQPRKLATAVTMGIWDCIKLYTEKPPKGSQNNFGLQAFWHWAKLLTQPKARRSWAKEFPAGRKMYAGLVNAYYDINIFGKTGRAERDLYADFLDEVSLILERPALSETADLFRRCGDAWDALSLALLPDEVAPFHQARELMQRRQHLFVHQGNAALAEISQIDGRLQGLRQSMATDFPLDEAGVKAMRQRIAERVLALHDAEEAAVTSLKAAMSD